MSRRLRLQGFVIQPVVVWDDGDTLTPGPTLNPVNVPGGELAAFVERWPGEFDAFRADAEAAGAASQQNRPVRRARKSS